MSSHLTDAQYAAFIDRLIACRQAEDDAKEDTKLVYAELAEAGEDKTAAGLIVRGLRMSAKDRAKANLRDAAVENGMDRYNRGKASHVRAREASIPEHDAETGEVIEHSSRAKAAHAVSREEDAGERQHSSNSGMAGADEPGRQTSASADADPAPIHPSEAAMLPQTAGSETAVANSTPGSGAGTVDAGGANWPSEMTTASPANEPETIPPAADPTVVVSEAGDDRSAGTASATVVAFRINTKTHFANSKGLPRLHGCLKPEACGGSHRSLCFGCSVQHDGPAHHEGAA